jgi:hypothetical protein
MKLRRRASVLLIASVVILLVTLGIGLGTYMGTPQRTLTVGVNYASLFWHLDSKYTTDDVIRRDMNTFQQAGIRLVGLPVHWSYLEPVQGQYRISFLDNITRFCRLAEEHNISVVIDFHAPVHDDDYPIPSWVQPREFQTVLDNVTIRKAWLEMLASTSHHLENVTNIHSWHLMNEPNLASWGLQASIDEFIELIKDGKAAIRRCSNRPVTVRFTVDTLLDFDLEDSTRILEACDYVALNWYERYASVKNLTDLVGKVRESKKDIMISEWGLNTDNDQEQYDAYVRYLDLFKSLGINSCLAWIWRSDNDLADNPGKIGVGHMLSKNTLGEPRLAFTALADANLRT